MRRAERHRHALTRSGLTGFVRSILVLCAALPSSGFLSAARAAPAGAGEEKPAEPRTFISVYECVFKGKFSKTVCIDAFDDAYDVYRERAPRFKTRAECNAVFKVCVVFNPPGYGGRPPPPLKPQNVTYAPPFLGAVLSPEGDARKVLIDTTRKPLAGGVPQRYGPDAKEKLPGFAGTNFAPPSGTFVPRNRNVDARYRDAPEHAGDAASIPLQGGAVPLDQPGAISLDGVSTFPVPENRRRNRSP